MSACGLSDCRTAAAYAGVSALTALGLWVGRWIKDRSAHRRLEEAQRVVAQIDQVVSSIPPETREAIHAEEPQYLARINESVEIIHSRLSELEARSQEADLIDIYNFWSPLVVSLSQFTDEARSIQDEVQTTSSNAARALRDAGLPPHYGRRDTTIVAGSGVVDFKDSTAA